MSLDDEIVLRSELFEGLDEKVCRSMLELVGLRAVAVNERIVAEGQRASHVFCVLSGVVRLTKAEAGGREADVCICEPGDCFGEYLVPMGDAYAHGAWAAAPVELAQFDLPGLRALAAEHGGIQRNVMRIMARHLLGSLDCIAGDRLHTAAQRVANYFVSRCPNSASQATFRLPYQKRVLAGKLGLAPEALSRAFAALSGAGVDVRGRTVCIGSVAQLREAC
ncbi:Crp/Fnr family transcriptional regulator [Rhizobium leguminosarum]|uniref:Crp/Fnr family transcriptional regulator n=1 Tax=Rhizobium TaxID=379 RepID=UPI000477D7B1|nr:MULTISPECIES: Crp/Fnr family transcriptional regulator [Rhizobium]MBY5369158.1 Crp/Fnr family transcriptional regulator [Rhizobium leguminosarum]MBY5405100.1 Crp/Fnr family transcriptional regulator [Rhizobium leguminosarum]MBY5446747.1 Crp/Fnr family transcriptional regulator [Rhizobium leguminosarum]MBY5452154.1 Crp/Fnr family transcriptional regulator [Rhizobium leguminosarum]NDK51953.1 Crp/Fnr family transcriptional regulator [Rhizobium laguerreae]